MIIFLLFWFLFLILMRKFSLISPFIYFCREKLEIFAVRFKLFVILFKQWRREKRKFIFGSHTQQRNTLAVGQNSSLQPRSIFIWINFSVEMLYGQWNMMLSSLFHKIFFFWGKWIGFFRFFSFDSLILFMILLLKIDF